MSVRLEVKAVGVVNAWKVGILKKRMGRIVFQNVVMVMLLEMRNVRRVVWDVIMNANAFLVMKPRDKGIVSLFVVMV